MASQTRGELPRPHAAELVAGQGVDLGFIRSEKRVYVRPNHARLGCHTPPVILPDAGVNVPTRTSLMVLPPW